jgi:hypothetical protein
MLIGICDAFIVLFAKFVLLGVGVRVAPPPELLDKVLALFIGCKSLEGLFFFVSDDVGDIVLKLFFVNVL